jgi:hypothetical protein
MDVRAPRAGSNSRCRRKSNSANSSCRTRNRPAWKWRASSILRCRSSGSVSPVCQWRANRSSVSRCQQKFSMNWLGSSTASHSTPLMPPTLGQSTSVSMWCRPWPNSWNIVITSSCVSRQAGCRPAGRNCRSERRLVPAGRRRCGGGNGVGHPGTTALMITGVQVEVEASDQIVTSSLDVIEAGVSVPGLCIGFCNLPRHRWFRPL